MRAFIQRHYFFLRRLHSLLGIIPFGGFLLLHLFLNSRTAQGTAQYQWVPDTLDQIPFLWAIEIFGLLLPMLTHAGLGVMIALMADYGGPAKMRSYWEHWGFIFQRVSGALLLVLLLIHLWQTWWQHIALKMAPMFEGTEPQHFDIYGLMNNLVYNNAWLVVYALFVVLAAFHFGNGIYNFAYKWGFATSRPSQRAAIALGLGVALLCVGLGFTSLWGLRFSPHAREAEARGYGVEQEPYHAPGGLQSGSYPTP
jgi:succinate dehydrogenase / fumarate reductase cytochrome b subunit